MRFTFFALWMALGYWVTIDSWNGYGYVYLGDQRGPAAMRSIREYAQFDMSALKKSLPKQLLGTARVFKKEGYVGVILGHPLFQRGKGTGEFACPIQDRPGVFTRVEVEFTGVGISESGEQAKLTAETDCLPSNTLTELRTVWIPMESILASEPKDQELQIYGDQPVVIRVTGIVGQWPESWVLSGVKLFSDENPDEAMRLEMSELREARPALMTFDWKPGDAGSPRSQ
ncbi:MAG TPA: hypothetical protein PKC28_02205 [Bdellovibrionales bacterium]|nr:hypothetical protein [Bdellovibrionales bacterium]